VAKQEIKMIKQRRSQLYPERAFAAAFKELAEVVESADDGTAIRAILEAQAHRNQTRAGLIDAATRSVDMVLEELASAQSGSGWSTVGVLGGSGYTVYVGDPVELCRLTAECRTILNACSLKIQTASEGGSDLEAHRPEASVNWLFVASGYWSEDMYHAGHIAYSIANPRSGYWVMEAREHNAILDDVTEEDVEEGRLDDDQTQAMWGQTLEEAQNHQEYRHIVAWSDGVNLDCTAQEMATVLYRAVCKSGGKEITQPNDAEGLVEF
jgi:hypothetical protein